MEFSVYYISLRQRVENLWRVFLTQLPPWEGLEDLTLLLG